MSEPAFVDPAAPVAQPAAARDMLGDFLAFAELLQNIDPVAQKAKELRELEIRVAVERENLAAAKRERGDLDARAAALDRREAELGLREHEQAAKFDDARRELVTQHRRLVETETAIKFRVLRHAGALAGFDARLQSVPDWSAIDRLTGGPVDVVEEMRTPNTQTTREGFGGDQFAPSTLTRSVPMSEHDDLPSVRPPPVKRPSRRNSFRTAMQRAMQEP